MSIADGDVLCRQVVLDDSQEAECCVRVVLDVSRIGLMFGRVELGVGQNGRKCVDLSRCAR